MKRAMIAAAAVAVLLTGCQGLSTQITLPSVPPSTQQDSAPKPTPAPAKQPEVQQQKPESKQQEQDTSSADSCIVGAWAVDPDSFGTAMSKLGGVISLIGIEGDLLVQFNSDGTYKQLKDNFTIVSSIQGMQARSVTTGLLSGKYIIEGPVIHLVDSVDNNHESYLELEGAGRVELESDQDAEIQIFGYQASVPNDATFGVYDGAGKFECDGDKLLIDIGGSVVTWLPAMMPDTSAFNE